jgi:hypothetical protein
LLLLLVVVVELWAPDATLSILHVPAMIVPQQRGAMHSCCLPASA